VVYVGTWLTASDPRVSGGTVKESNNANDTATLSFNGTGVSWISFKGTFGGIAQVLLDGTLVATVDTFATSDQPQAVVFTASGLPAGSHILTIKVTGTSSTGGGTFIVVDAFDVTS